MVQSTALCPYEDSHSDNQSVAKIEKEKSARSFIRPKFVVDVRALSRAADMLVSQDLEELTEVFERMPAAISSPKLPLWTDVSFQKR